MNTTSGQKGGNPHPTWTTVTFASLPVRSPHPHPPPPSPIKAEESNGPQSERFTS